MIKLGDKGLAVEYINYLFGINSKEFTAETESKIKQFQASYGQVFTDESASYFDPTDENNNDYDNFNTELELYPNGVLDIYSLPSLLNTDITLYDEHILTQVQNALSFTEFTEDDNNLKRAIQPTGNYNDITKSAIKKFQQKYHLFQVKIPIIEHKNLLSNVASDWTNEKYTYTYSKDSNNVISITSASLVDSDDCILSPVIPIESGELYYIKLNNELDNYYIKIMFFDSSLTPISHLSSVYTPNVTSTSENQFDGWVNTDSLLTEGLIPYNQYCEDSSTTVTGIIKYIQIMVRHTDGSDIETSEIEPLEIQLEKNDKATSYEPYSYNEYNGYCSGYLNIPTYNMIKKVFNLKEADF